MWLKDGTVQCDNCSIIFDFPGPRVMVATMARSRGWHIFRGPSLSGKDLDSALCDECVGTNRTRPGKPKRFDEEVPLF